MGAVNIENIPRTSKNITRTRRLALSAAKKRHERALSGGFDQTGPRTLNWEVEARAVREDFGARVDATALFDSGIAEVIPDTSTDHVEFNAAAEPQELTPDGMERFYEGLIDRTKSVDTKLAQEVKGAILVPIGLQPVVFPEERDAFLITEGSRGIRNRLIQEATARENSEKTVYIKNPFTDKAVEFPAVSNTAMNVSSGTQFHISEGTVGEAMAAHNVSIAIAPLMIALFGNSPFAYRMDTGRESSRMMLIRRAEQKRAGLPPAATDLLQYYTSYFERTEPAFMELENPEEAANLTHGAAHYTSRIIVDSEQGTIRNEFRHIDAVSPHTGMQAFLLTLGLVDYFKDKQLPSYPESQSNLEQSEFGLNALMSWRGRKATAREFGIHFIQIAKTALQKQGLGKFASEFLDPLKADLQNHKSPAKRIRQSVNSAMSEGATFDEAIGQTFRELHAEALQH